jgi:hypothetical protein
MAEATRVILHSLAEELLTMAFLKPLPAKLRKDQVCEMNCA